VVNGPIYTPPPAESLAIINRTQMQTATTPEKTSPMSELGAITGQLRSLLDRPDKTFGKREGLTELIEKYNSVVEDINLLERKPRHDPIERLPEEVSVTVLKHAALRDSYGFSFISTGMTILMTCVSSKWRRFIESTPTLWSDIILDDGREDLATKVTMSLFLSREAFLNVQFVSPMRCWNEIESILQPHAGRIRNIYLQSGGANKNFQNFSFFTVNPLSNVQLQSVGWGPQIYTTALGGKLVIGASGDGFFKSIGIPFRTKALLGPSIRHVKELATHEDARRILAENPPPLEKVEFREMHIVDRGSNGIPLTMETLNWTSLTYRQGITETLTSLLSRLPLLCELNVRIAYDDLSESMSYMQDLQLLHRLELTLWRHPKETFLMPTMMKPLDRAQTFILRQPGNLSKDALGKLSQIPNAFLSLVPNINFLELHCHVDSMVYELTSATGFYQVHTLSLNLSALGRGSPPEDFPLSKSVRSLKISFNGAVGFIAAEVESLQVITLDLDNAGGQYSTVQRLHFTHLKGVSNNLQPFTALTDLFVAGDEAVTRFCAILARSPEYSPALHTLSFGQFPDLDVLFIMLERRNLYSHAARARIRKLRLPTHLPLSNFRTIRDLLRGRMVERQSNYEASLQSNIDIFADADM
jgi:hypothetical protein